MRTLDYIDLLNLSAKLAGLDPGQVAVDEFATFRLFHSDRLKRMWDHRDWSDLKRTEKRYFRPLYVNTTYAPGEEVYYPGPRKYYQALRAVIAGQAPANFNGTDWTPNLDYWAESKQSYISGSYPEYVATHTYVKGNVTYYSLTDQFYQLFVANATGSLPTDATKWGALTPFNRYVGYEQPGYSKFEQAYSAWSLDPRNDGRAQKLTAFQSNDGVQILEDVAFVWLAYKLRRPRLTGDVFDAAATYAIGQQVYYTSASARGNFYDCVAATAAGETPDSAAGKWALVELPAQWETWLAHGAAADYALPNGDVMVRDREHAIAQDDLERQAVLHDGLTNEQQEDNVMVR